MGEAFKKVQAGQRLEIPAVAYNTFIDMARDWLAGQMEAGGGPGADRRQTGIVPVRNDSGDDLDRFAILGIDGVVYTPADNEDGFENGPALKGVTPLTPDHLGKFVVLQEPVANGAIGRACLQGLTPVKVWVSQTHYECADVRDGHEGHLIAAATGAAHILWREEGTGTKWAFVRLGQPTDPWQPFWGKITAVNVFEQGPNNTVITYDFEEVYLANTGRYGWVALPQPPGRTGTMLNGPENATYGWAPMLQVGSVVRIWPVVTVGGDVDYWSDTVVWIS
jgi:hypothetical protein